MIKRMAARGFDAVPIDAYRTPDEAARNATKGTGIKLSLHLLGAACDFVEQGTGWSNPKFFKALGEEAKALGLVWGGTWAKPDRPHCQAVPVNWQTQLRSMKHAQQRDQLAAKWLGRTKLPSGG